jgi:hypothetical protein
MAGIWSNRRRTTTSTSVKRICRYVLGGRRDGSVKSSCWRISACATIEAATFGVMVVATAAVWGHTIDEIRIGEMSAIAAGVLNLGLLAGWNRLGVGWRGLAVAAVRLFLDDHRDSLSRRPPVEGVTTWQNISGLLRVVGGIAMIVAGIRILGERRSRNSSIS